MIFKNFSYEEVQAQVKLRNPEFLKLLFESVNPVMIKVLYTNKIYAADSEEILHQTWLRYFENYQKFQGQSLLSTFIIGILFNKIKEYRRLQKKFVFEDDSEAIYKQSFNQDGWWVTKPNAPDYLLETQDLSESIEECLEGLTEQQKTAFLLKEVQDESTDEICNILGVSLSNMRVLIFRAKDKLKKCLEGKSGSAGIKGYR